MLEFILDGVTVTEPEGLRELRHRIYYNDGINGYLEQFDGSVSFYGTEYRTLRNRFFADGCAVVPVEVRNGGDSYLGNIFLNDAEWEPDKSKVTCEIVDGSFLSLIDNNKDIKAYLNVPRSKNDVDISAVTVVQTDLSFGENEVGVGLNPTPANRSGVRVFDAFKFLIAFMSDGQIGFVSDYFSPETDPADPTEPRNPTLITGQEVGTADGDEWPYLSFEELFTDINKLYNISFSMEVVNGIPTMRIEPKAYFRSIAQTLAVADALDVQQEALRESYYQLMKFGDSEKVDEEGFYPPATFAAWQREEYHLGGQCNTKAVLDLQLKTLIINTNAIQSQLPSSTQNIVSPPSEEYDEDIFLVIFDGNNQTVLNVNPLDANKRYYNARLQNDEVANRWGDGVPFPIFLFLGAGNNGSQGYALGNVTANDITCISISQWVSVAKFNSFSFPFGYDPNGLMSQSNVDFPPCIHSPNNNVIGTTYTAPISAIYTVAVDFQTTWVTAANIIVVDATDAITQIIPLPITVNGPFDASVVGSVQVFVPSGDRIAIRLVQFSAPTPIGGPGGGFDPNPPQNPVVFNGGTFTVYDPLTITKTYDPASNYLFKSSAQYPLPSDWWRQFRTQWHQRIQLTYGSGQAQGYVREISRNIYTGEADVEIVSKFADVTL
jgi:hypothetical protein